MEKAIQKGSVRAKDTGTQWRVSDNRTVKTEVTKKSDSAPIGFTADQAIEVYNKFGTEANFRETHGFDNSVLD